MTEKEFLEKYSDCAFVPFDKLEAFMRACLIHSGVPEGDADIIFYDVPPYKASSTDVREGDFSELTTDVRRYIEEHGLYNS